MKIIAAMILTLWAGMASATTEELLPALHDVTGVAADDVLNIRSGPGTGNPVIAALPPDARGVEVVAASEDGAWGLVNTGEGSGWVSMAFLARQPGQFDGYAPAIATCFGTEPFWDLTEGPGGWQVTTPEGPQERFTPLVPAGPSGWPQSFAWLGDGAIGALVVTREQCSDGMSDRAYGLSAALATPSEGGATLRTGCCALTR
ncbi:SH3 domain-containing protein [Pseudoroseicyclus sp. CXY001]|uniref:SH3 domain-containing protein n=1 Tax=Pseudoroseicyclus sp. CXY001 TaxID=3242492 RepID=UPI003570D4ED